MRQNLQKAIAVSSAAKNPGAEKAQLHARENRLLSSTGRKSRFWNIYANFDVTANVVIRTHSIWARDHVTEVSG